MKPIYTKIDWYITKKYLGTFFFSILLVMSIAIVFDMTEKMDNFFEHQLTWSEIFWDYYINFIPYYLNMFATLFIFISVIVFTSKMAGDSEIIAMMASGISYWRLLRPYLVCAGLLSVAIFFMAGYVIPPASKKLLIFTDKYVQHFSHSNGRNLQVQVLPNEVLYMETFQLDNGIGYRASLENFEGKSLKRRITADRIRHIEGDHWQMENYTLREFNGLRETLNQGDRLDLDLPLRPNELFYASQDAEMMTNTELSDYIDRQRERGGDVTAFQTQYHKRWASALGAFIMTLLGVTMSSKRIRGGMGKNLGIGIVLAAGYILFSTVSTTFAVNGLMSAFMAAWLPNFVFIGITDYLYIRAKRRG